jgi:hypothetical protein
MGALLLLKQPALYGLEGEILVLVRERIQSAGKSTEVIRQAVE